MSSSHYQSLIVTVGFLSDKYNLRGPFVIAGCFVSLIGFIVLYTQEKAGASYAGAVIAAVGVYPTIAVDLAWAGSATGGDTRKGVALPILTFRWSYSTFAGVMIAMVVGTGNLGG